MILVKGCGTEIIFGLAARLVMACPPVPSGFPVLGSNTMPPCAGTEPPSVVGTINGLPQATGGDRSVGANVIAQQSLKIAAALGRRWVPW